MAQQRCEAVCMASDRPLGEPNALRESQHRLVRRRAGQRLGHSLNLVRTAQDLADCLVPGFADLAAVALAEAVLTGEEPPRFTGGGQLHLRRVAVAAASGSRPTEILPPGAKHPPYPDSPLLRAAQRGDYTLVADRAKAVALLGDQELIRLFIPPGGHSVIVAQLFARGLVLGNISLWRTAMAVPFTDEDGELIREIASRAAIAVDNARRYTREHRVATDLQRRLMPRGAQHMLAVETAGRYVPAGEGVEVGGDWFDVIPLSSLRVALVIGDVIGHGLHATAMMGQVRTAVRALADMELDPGELLSHLDDVIQRLAYETECDHHDGESVGGSCLYAVYDPVGCTCALASAGHPPPFLMHPDRTIEQIHISPGPPLGVGGLPFEVTEVSLEPGSLLALYTDGLTDQPAGASDGGADIPRLLATLTGRGSSSDLETLGRKMVSQAVGKPARDDIALLLARVHALPAEHVADWAFAADPAAVTNIRKEAVDRLVTWGLSDAAFSTELIVSELVTNAIRYGDGPYTLRLIRGDVLVCEVSDRSNTQPRLRRARSTDEGGRGLFLVAQIADRWGSRYQSVGKTVWAEQHLPSLKAQQAG
ncbi:SpoIIE family protein phosphatase [Streptomyces sp. NEAU-YJ-81]|uniref:ATP-binding SpoIIE family protein phosphatase n=1 Tax=Streptomyces sp. NEAU-YJ-81 TaxID=2820288 RepID=UPI001ABD3018|nr:SpoIIE family protein phosphatase [Streptomyces sp. NEAU-YJ-81]MBO3682504.1 SpoIIE family protein phosphatase [Streptomyces sp. NEAU-YJ-81]